MVSDQYLRRPTPEYSQTFDLVTKAINEADGPTLAVLSSVAFAVELLKRCPGSLNIAGMGLFDAGSFTMEAEKWAWGSLAVVSLTESSQLYKSILWAEPEANSASRVVTQLRKQAGAVTELWVVSSAPLRRFMPAWQENPPPAASPPGPARVCWLLRQNGWQVQDLHAYHGPRSIAWTLLARAAGRLGRPDWEDRCTMMVRSHYREPGWLWPLAPMALIHARAK